MSAWFDDLTRIIASEIPRREMLRYFLASGASALGIGTLPTRLSALATAGSAGGAARPSAAFGAAAAFVPHGSMGGKPEACVPASQTHADSKLCTQSGASCPGGATKCRFRGDEPCFTTAGQPTCGCCPEGLKCCPGATDPRCCPRHFNCCGDPAFCCHPICGVCNPATNVCDPVCPKPGQDANISLCCPDETTVPSSFVCCDARVHCCSTNAARVPNGGCCPKPRIRPLFMSATVPVSVAMQATDSGGSGIVSVSVVKAVNATVSIPLIQSASPSVDVVATKIDPSLSSQVVVRVCTLCGTAACCVDGDPVITTVIRHAGKPATETYADLPEAESKIAIHNGTPGVRNLRFTVNGRQFQVAGLKDGEQVALDVASAMRPGNGNTIAIAPLGAPSGSATVFITD